jgi:hypothetical protein
VVHLRDAIDRLSDPKYLPVSTGNVSALADMVCEALFTTRRQEGPAGSGCTTS